MLAVGVRAVQTEPGPLLAGLPEPSLVVALEGLTNHDNVGGIFRNANAFGAGAVVLDRRCCDPLYRKAIRVSAGCVLRVPYGRCETSSAMIQGLQRAGYTVLALSPRADAAELSDFGPRYPVPARAALLLGTEGPGLSAEALASADQVVRIDIEQAVDSLNVATTSGIALYAIRMAQRLHA